MRPVSDLHLKEWHVAFCDVKRPNFVQKFLKPGFRHCWAFTFDPDADVWLVFDPAWYNCVIRAVPKPIIGAFINKAINEGPVLCMPVQQRPIRKSRIFLSCVSQISHLLGVDLFLATPYQLFCELQKNGAETRFKEIPIEPPEAPYGHFRSSHATPSARTITSGT